MESVGKGYFGSNALSVNRGPGNHAIVKRHEEDSSNRLYFITWDDVCVFYDF